MLMPISSKSLSGIHSPSKDHFDSRKYTVYMCYDVRRTVRKVLYKILILHVLYEDKNKGIDVFMTHTINLLFGCCFAICI